MSIHYHPPILVRTCPISGRHFFFPLIQTLSEISREEFVLRDLLPLRTGTGYDATPNLISRLFGSCKGFRVRAAPRKVQLVDVCGSFPISFPFLDDTRRLRGRRAHAETGKSENCGRDRL